MKTKDIKIYILLSIGVSLLSAIMALITYNEYSMVIMIGLIFFFLSIILLILKMLNLIIQKRIAMIQEKNNI